MSKGILSTICAILLCGGTTVSVAQEKAAGPIKIGVIADMSGIYQGNSGKGATVAVQLAVEDMRLFGRFFDHLDDRRPVLGAETVVHRALQQFGA